LPSSGPLPAKLKPKSPDAIVAIATAPGKGGVGVVRLSVPVLEHAQALFAALFPRLAQRCLSAATPPVIPSATHPATQLATSPQTSTYTIPSGVLPTVRYAHLVRLCNGNAQAIDEGVFLYFAAPASYTGEHVFEFQGHGGQAVLQAVVARCLEAARSVQVPLRHAQAGEFTQRAFLNDKLDLAQAEAVADLIDAGSAQAAKAAAASLTGVFSKQVHALADGLVHLRLLLEATLDFPEEEIEFLEKANALGQLQTLQNTHQTLLAAAQEGLRFREGLTVVLAGSPNVGKSSLMNALAGDDVAIVSPMAGTTRDRIVQQVNIRGIPLVLVDTAGLRETQDTVEQMGIARTRDSLAKADVVLLLEEATDRAPCPEIPIESIRPGVPCLRVLNKIDLLLLPHFSPTERPDVLLISAKTGQGVEDLKTALLAAIGLQAQPSEHAFMARQRHVDALVQCGQHLEQAAQCAVFGDAHLDVFAEELRLAHDCLGEITGRMLPDDLLGLIFGRFCIGK
jgi:tRNA modification GTPase